MISLCTCISTSAQATPHSSQLGSRLSQLSSFSCRNKVQFRLVLKACMNITIRLIIDTFKFSDEFG